jgi:hypothetical protein
MTALPPPKCRHCGAPLTRSLVDLGLSPLANSYVPPERADVPDPMYPLHARVCDECLLVQVDDVVPAAEIFNQDYAYFSSFSDSWLAHCRDYAEAATGRFGLGPSSLVLEIASNDGYLLQYFAARGIAVLGVEPAANVAAVAEARGIPTRVDFFGKALADALVAEGIRPDLICSANVLAHVPDINDFVAGVATLLSEDAVYTVEFPHLANLIRDVQFDTIYHEHYSYLSLVAVEGIFAGAGLRVFDVETLPTHGGSLRVYACRADSGRAEQPAVAAVRQAEHAARLDRPEGYEGFEARVQAVRDGLLAYLRAAKTEGRRVAAYGAAAKGNTLLNYCGVGPELIDYAVDRNPAKQNTLLPGSRIPVRPVEALSRTPPDDILILPWNIRDEIVAQLDDLRQKGVRFVTAVPKITVIG